jgi:hypothetical protein
MYDNQITDIFALRILLSQIKNLIDEYKFEYMQNHYNIISEKITSLTEEQKPKPKLEIVKRYEDEQARLLEEQKRGCVKCVEARRKGFRQCYICKNKGNTDCVKCIEANEKGFLLCFKCNEKKKEKNVANNDVYAGECLFC